MPRNDFLVGGGNICRIQWVIAYETFSYHNVFLIVKSLCGIGSGNGTDAKYYVVITRSLISLVFSLASSYSKPSIYRFLYNLVVGPPPIVRAMPRNAAELGKMGNHYRCLVGS